MSAPDPLGRQKPVRAPQISGARAAKWRRNGSGPGAGAGSGTRVGVTLTLLAALTALAPLSIDLYTPSLPQMQQDLGAADWLAQATVTACLLGIGVGQLFWGPLSDRYGRRPIILIGAAAWTLASALSAVSTTAGVLIAFRLLAGLCGAACIVAARSAVRDITVDPRVQAARVGMLSLVSAAAPIVAPLIGAVVGTAWGWRADFWVLAVVGVAITALFAALVPETQDAAQRALADGHDVGIGRSVRLSLATALRSRELVAIAAPFAAFAFGFYAYVASASFIVEREFGYPPLVFGLVFGTNALAMVGANLVFRRLVRRYRPASLFTVGLVAATAAGALLLLAGLVSAPAGVAWAASLLFASSAGFVLPGGHAAGQATLVAAGAASALTGAAQFLGGVLGSPVTGAVGPSVITLGAILVLAPGVALLLRRTIGTRHG